jgi:hypothetical protein
MCLWNAGGEGRVSTLQQLGIFFSCFLFFSALVRADRFSPLSQVFDSLTMTPLSLTIVSGGSVIIFPGRCCHVSLSLVPHVCVLFFPSLFFLLI